MSNTEMHTPELAEVEVEIGRGAFLTKGALAVGAIYGATAVGPFVRRALAQGGGPARQQRFLPQPGRPPHVAGDRRPGCARTSPRGTGRCPRRTPRPGSGFGK